MEFPGITIGLANHAEWIVGDNDMAISPRGVALEGILSTPRLIEMMIEASIELLQERLPEGFVAVGKASHITHEAPCVYGSHLSMDLTLEEFDGYHVTISMRAYDQDGIVASGEHVRTVVNQRFLQSKLNQKMASVTMVSTAP